MELTKIQMLLHERGLTQKELVNMINERYEDLPINANTLNRFVTGDRPDVRLSTVYRICGALNVTPNEILDLDFLA